MLLDLSVKNDLTHSPNSFSALSSGLLVSRLNAAGDVAHLVATRRSKLIHRPS